MLTFKAALHVLSASFQPLLSFQPLFSFACMSFQFLRGMSRLPCMSFQTFQGCLACPSFRRFRRLSFRRLSDVLQTSHLELRGKTLAPVHRNVEMYCRPAMP